MTYVQLKHIDLKWFELTKKQMKEFPETLLHLGISMSDTPSGEPEKHYEKDVLDGKYDKNIIEMCEALKKWGKPCFIRLGFEFNGLKWFGYNYKDYVKAWKYVIDKCRKYHVKNAIWVWHYSPEGEKNYMDYYPGDYYADWWAISVFKPRDFGANTIKYLKDAKKHRKSVMIAESAPVLIGTANKKVWDKWFKPYFSLIQKYDIKSFNYINIDWKNTSTWSKWKDCRINNNKNILKKNDLEISKLK